MTFESNDPVNTMLNLIASNEKICPEVYKSDSQDLTLVQKYDFSRELLDRAPGLFLEKFYKYISYEVALACFKDALIDNNMVQYYINKIKNVGNVHISRNRRHKKMEQLFKEGNYFSFESMKNREPILYETYVREYNTGLEDDELLGRTYDSFSGYLLRNMLNLQDSNMRQNKAAEEEKKLETHDEHNDGLDDEEEVDEDGLKCRENFECKVTEKDSMRDEFIDIMKAKFVNGEDNFNYSDVDNDSNLDDQEELARDREELYFNTENDPEEMVIDNDDTNSEGSFIGPNDHQKLAEYLNKK